MTNEKYEMGMKSAPLEIFVARREGKLLAISNGLAEAGKNGDSNQPVKLHAGFSRFPVSVKNGDKYATANFSVQDLPLIIKHTQAAADREIETELSGNAGEGAGPAYTQKIMVGSCKGKTPVQILTEKGPNGMAGQAKLLNDTYKWLKNNYDPGSAYAAGNQAQMDAIAEAARLYKEGKIDTAQASAGAFTIAESGFRALVNRKKNANGKNFVYEYRIVWTFGNDSPVCVSITNYYATVVIKDDGRQNVMPQTAEDKYTNTIYLTEKEWLWAVHMMETSLAAFEQGYAKDALKECLDRDAANRNAAMHGHTT